MLSAVIVIRWPFADGNVSIVNAEEVGIRGRIRWWMKDMHLDTAELIERHVAFLDQCVLALLIIIMVLHVLHHHHHCVGQVSKTSGTYSGDVD